MSGHGVSGKRSFKRAAGVVAGVLLGLSILMFVPRQAGANIPVIDTAAITQLVQQYMQMLRQMDTLVQQVALLKAQISAVTGHYGYGALGQNTNAWGSSAWSDIASMVASGVNPGDAEQVRLFKEARARYAAGFPVLSQNFVPQNPRMRAAYSQAYTDALAGASMGEGTFNEVNSYLADVQALKDRIDRTDNLKGAVDLNTAVNVRVAQLSGEILRMQAAQMRLESARQMRDVSGQSAQVEFFSE